MDTQYNSLTHGSTTLEEVLVHIKTFLAQDQNAEYSLIIGSDSQEKSDADGKRKIRVVTAIVVHRKGFGGKYFWQQKPAAQVHNLREKIYAETMTSLDFARTFVPLLKKTLNG